MQSCPRCGTQIGPDDKTCPLCGAALPSASHPASPLAGTTPPDTPRAFSLENQTPQAPSTPQNTPAFKSGQPGTESWGPGTWGPGEDPASATTLWQAAPEAPSLGPQRGQPPVVREYSAGGAPRSYVPYRPPAGLAGDAYPGYPVIPQNGRVPGWPGYAVVPGAAGVLPSPSPAYPAPAGYLPHPPAPGYPYGWYPPAKPPRAPGETYQKVVSILALIACSLLLLGGLIALMILAVLSLFDSGEDLSVVNLFVMGTIAALVGGGVGMYHSIRALMRQPSVPFSLPHHGVLAAISLAILGTGLALFALTEPTGPLAMIEPLVLLSGIAPAFTFLALALQRLGTPGKTPVGENQSHSQNTGLQVLLGGTPNAGTSWRHIWLALTSGSTLSVGVALVLEAVFALALLGFFNMSDLNPTTFNPSTSNRSAILGLLLLVAVGAPLIEETTKQISGFFLLPRIKGPQDAFLIGMASGIGFAILETSSYIGTGQADWVGIAIQRVGAGLLHGLGAAIAGVGWYYLLRGKGVRRRWWLGFGCLIYAYIQHAIFNGGAVLLLVASPTLQTWHVNVFDLHFDASVFYAGALYVIMLGVLLGVTTWLRRSAPVAGRTPTAPRITRATLSVAPERDAATAPASNTIPTAETNTLQSAINNAPLGVPHPPGAKTLAHGTPGSIQSGGQA